MKQKKTALFQSVIALILCISMLMGTTFAWFTDSVTTGINTIAAGVLDVELYHSNAAVADERVDTNTKLFMDLNGNPILWEPGVVSYENLRITNAGDLALAYQLALNTDNENFVVEESGAQYGLSQILKVGFVEGGITATDRAGVVASVEEGNWTTLASFVRSGALLPEGEGESEKTWGVVIYWEPGENDNYWNLNNGKQLNEGEVLMIDLGVKLIATQEGYESDSFGADYDSEAKLAVFPVFVAPGSTTTTVVPNDQNQVASGLEMTAGQVSASIPAGVQLAAGTTELTMSVSEMNQSDANISLGVNEAMRSLDVHIEGVDNENNTVPMTITLKEIAPVGLNMGNYKLYHVENGQTNEMNLVEEFTAHNQFKYNPATGDVTLYMATFSEVALVADTVNAWNGEFKYEWYNAEAKELVIANADQLAAFGAIVGGMDGQTRDSFAGKTVKLIADINLGDDEVHNNEKLIFYPIGYYNNTGDYSKRAGKVGPDGTDVTSGFYTFNGIFDGNGHTIANFYQNTWEMFGDYNDGYSGTPNHFRDGMGLFGKVYGGTVKNLTVANFSSDGEYTTTGCVAAYADGATFENIAIFNCNPRVYNIGNGGIVGCVGWYAKEAGKLTTLKNITVDNSNKISALWGSYDVACGGLVGQYYPTSGQTSAGTPKNAGIHMENCHVAAQMDVYNDVCGNYQYYAYRYAGMMIGSIRENTKTEDGKYVIPDMTGITASGCTVNYGDWNDYYYCEFEKNGHPSYSGPDDYKFSRVPDSELNFTDSNGNGKVDADERDSVTGCKHKHTDAEDNRAIYLPFHQLFTGYGWGVNSIGLEEYSGITVKDFNLDIEEDQEHAASAVKFGCQFPTAKVDKETGVITTDFLYRVGTLNEVAAGTLFNALDGLTNPVSGSGVYVSITAQHDDEINMGSFEAYTTDDDGDGDIEWEKGKITFNQTGIAKISIQDYDYCTPTVLYVEVVEAENITTATGSNGTDVVLLKNVQIASKGVAYYSNCTLYGNGFEYNVVGGVNTKTNGNNYHGIINLTNATIDNVRIVGEEYDKYGAYHDQEDYTAAINSTNSIIQNSYIANCSAPIRTKGDTNVINTTLYGGTVGNMIIESGTVTLTDVTTVNYNDGKKTVLGLGIVISPEATETAKLTLNGSFKQYNFVSEDDVALVKDADAKSVFNSMFGNSFKSYFIGTDPKYVNTGIISMTDTFDSADITDHANTGYLANDNASITVALPTGGTATKNGAVYSLPGEGNQVDNNYDPNSSANEQGAFGLVPDFDLGNQAVTGEDRYLRGDIHGVEARYVEGENAFTLDITKLMTVTKYGKNLSVTAACKDKNGNALNAPNGIITLNTAGSYILEFVVADNLIYGADGKLTGESVTHIYKVPLVLDIAEPAIKDAVITVNKTALDGGYNESYGDRSYKFNPLAAITITDAEGTVELTTNIASTNIVYASSSSAFAGATTITVTYNDGRILEIKLGKPSLNSPGSSKAITYADDGTIKSAGKVASKSATGGTWTVTSYSFKGTNGKTVTNNTVVTFTFPDKSCVTGDTLVMLADGSQKRIDEVAYSDQLLVWNFFSGKYDVVPAAIIFYHGDDYYRVLQLNFSDGTKVKVLNNHGFYDVVENAFIFIDEENVEFYIGHKFAKVDGKSTKNIELVGYEIYEEYTGCYSIQSAMHNNFMVEGMFSLTIPEYEGWFDYFEIGEDMKYDEAKMQADIAKYGLYDYSEFAEYVTYEQFIAFNGPYLKVLVGRGVVTFEQILELINTYVNN